jgi:ubiquinone/menaquinone biosynthesis C-methylase UbiE
MIIKLEHVAVLATIVAISSVVAWWLFIGTEGAYLGRRVVVWLYNLYAHLYDGVKNYYPEYEQIYLAAPIMEAIAPQKNPLVLDVATGTGRIPLALARHPEFDGHTIGVDLSRRMLYFATRNISPYTHRATFIWTPAENLPFPDNTFDVVTCLEALEFMSSPESVLQELVRVLRPGGLLLISQRINTRLMPGKTWHSEQVLGLMEQNGMENAHTQIWQVDYHKVWGYKAGESRPAGARPINEVLRCPRCRAAFMIPTTKKDHWHCENCGKTIPVGDDGVIELWEK